MKRVCSCGEFFDGKYCKRCRLSSAKRGYDYVWRKLRVKVLGRDPLCKDCEKEGKTRIAKEVHHAVPISQAPAMRLVESNLVPLCVKCHQKRHSDKMA